MRAVLDAPGPAADRWIFLWDGGAGACGSACRFRLWTDTGEKPLSQEKKYAFFIFLRNSSPCSAWWPTLPKPRCTHQAMPRIGRGARLVPHSGSHGLRSRVLALLSLPMASSILSSSAPAVDAMSAFSTGYVLPPAVRGVLEWRQAAGPFVLGGRGELPMTYANPPKARLPALAQSLRLADVLPGGGGINSRPKEEVSAARLVLGLLYLAVGGLDEAHAIAQIAASREGHYLHAMLHRQEGSAPGEAGLTGWANSMYWCVSLAPPHHAHERTDE